MAKFEAVAKEKNLDELYGCAPQSTLSRGHCSAVQSTNDMPLGAHLAAYEWDLAPYSPTAENHILSFYMNKVIPSVIIKTTDGKLNPYVLVLNNGFIRGPIYQGRFTKNDKCTSEFPAYVPAKKVIQSTDVLLLPIWIH